MHYDIPQITLNTESRELPGPQTEYMILAGPLISSLNHCTARGVPKRDLFLTFISTSYCYLQSNCRTREKKSINSLRASFSPNTLMSHSTE